VRGSISCPPLDCAKQGIFISAGFIEEIFLLLWLCS
jgi:hypothetical protein